MTLPTHSLARDLFDALAAGGGGPDAIRELAAAQRSKNLVMLHGVLAAARDAGTEQYQFARRGYELLEDIQRHDQAAADRVIRHPSVGAWALRTLRASRGGSMLAGAEPSGLSAVAAAAAIRARFAAGIEVMAANGTVVLPSLGAAVVSGRTAVVRSANGGAEIVSAGRQASVPSDPHRDAPGWRGLRRIQAGPLDVLLDDLDLFRMPALDGLAPRLSDIEISEWDAVVQRGWLLLEAECPATSAEVASAIAVIVPLNRSPFGQLSSSSAENFGAIAMSPPPDPYTCAVTLAHEIQHVKLSALLDIVPLTLPDDGRRYYAPWRDDPRPLSGLLQGAYAHLGVSGFWRKQRRSAAGHQRVRADKEFARWRVAAAQVVSTLESSRRLTPLGADFVRRMKKTLDAWLEEPVPDGARVLARREAQEHLARWQSAHGPLPGG